jgi:hypothetical protein
LRSDELFNFCPVHRGRTKKERWSEEEVLSLPSGELDYFDRKSGAIISDKDFQQKLAKALSAFANSGAAT